MIWSKAAFRGARRSYERFRMECSSCRVRRIPCDQTRPKCLNCLDKGLPCDGGVAVVPRRSVKIPRDHPIGRALVQQQPYNNAHEGRAFHFVAIDLAPLLGSLIDDVFWIESVLPAAYQDQRLFYAVLAYSCRYHNDTWTREPNHERQTIKWYNQSIHHSLSRFHSTANILLNIKMCGFYGLLENKHGNPQSGCKLIHTAFSIICSMQEELRYSEDAISTLSWLADTAVTSPSGLTRVPYTQFTKVCNIGLDMAQVSRYRARYDLSFGLWQIMYDVDSFLIGRECPPGLKTRIEYYVVQLSSFRVTPENNMAFLRLKFLYTLSRLQFELYQGEAEKTLQTLIKNLHLASRIKNCRKLILDAYIGPGLSFLAWHFRHDSLNQDITNILLPFNHSDYRGSLDYWLLLFHVTMNCNRCAIAIEIWGNYPRVLRLHQWLTLIRLGGGLKTLASVAPFLEQNPEFSSPLAEVSDSNLSQSGSFANAGDGDSSSRNNPTSKDSG